MKAKCRRMRSNKQKGRKFFCWITTPRNRRDKFPFYQSSCLLKMFSNFKSQNDCYGLCCCYTTLCGGQRRHDKRVKSVSQAEETCRRWEESSKLEKWKDINYESKMKMFSRVWADIHCDRELQQRHAKGWQRSFKFIVSPSQIKCATTVKLVGREWEEVAMGDESLPKLEKLWICYLFMSVSGSTLGSLTRSLGSHKLMRIDLNLNIFSIKKALKSELESLLTASHSERRTFTQLKKV